MRKGLKLPKLLLLVGLPGSGKSTFAEALVASGGGSEGGGSGGGGSGGGDSRVGGGSRVGSGGGGWVRICQDECGGSRRTCESAFEHAALKGTSHGRHVILDRWVCGGWGTCLMIKVWLHGPGHVA